MSSNYVAIFQLFPFLGERGSTIRWIQWKQEPIDKKMEA